MDWWWVGFGIAGLVGFVLALWMMRLACTGRKRTHTYRVVAGFMYSATYVAGPTCLIFSGYYRG